MARSLKHSWHALNPALAAVLAQGLTALSSVVVQVFAARQLGASGYGAFTVVNGVLLVVLAGQNGWVGDSLTVLDRRDPATRSSLTVSQLGFLVIGATACGGAVIALHYGSWLVAVDFCLMAVAYLVAELCRRVFMARQEFWPLSLNNLAFLLGTGAILLVQTHGGRNNALGDFALAVAGGSTVAVLAAIFQLPREEFRPGRLHLGGMRELTRFAVWRSAQIGVRPLALLGMRLIVSVVSGRAVVGQIEGARLLMAPATTFTQGVGSFILPMYAAEARGETPGRARVARVTLGVVGVTLALSVIPLLFPHEAQSLLTGGSFKIPTIAIAAWATFSVAFAFGLPSANRLVARRMSREVLLVRLLDASVGLAGVLIIALGGAKYAVAFGLAAGAFLGAFLTLRMSAGQARTPLGSTSALEPAL